MGSVSGCRRVLAVGALIAALAVGCGTDDDATPTPVDDGPNPSVARSVEPLPETDPPPTALDGAQLSPEGVIIAAVLLESGGDVDAALADGVFNGADLEAARSGLADGSLDYLFD